MKHFDESFKNLSFSGVEKIFNTENAEEDVDKILDAVDTNGSGAIDYMGNKLITQLCDFLFNNIGRKWQKEFLAATINKKLVLSKNRLEAAFQMLDAVILNFDE